LIALLFCCFLVAMKLTRTLFLLIQH
jgi:hypothetical protein